MTSQIRPLVISIDSIMVLLLHLILFLKSGLIDGFSIRCNDNSEVAYFYWATPYFCVNYLRGNTHQSLAYAYYNFNLETFSQTRRADRTVIVKNPSPSEFSPGATDRVPNAPNVPRADAAAYNKKLSRKVLPRERIIVKCSKITEVLAAIVQTVSKIRSRRAAVESFAFINVSNIAEEFHKKTQSSLSPSTFYEDSSAVSLFDILALEGFKIDQNVISYAQEYERTAAHFVTTRCVHEHF